MEPDFLAAIHAEPHSDTPRLVFADWLDERAQPGDAERAEFIRLSVQEPQRTFWEDTGPTDRASELAAACWDDWTEAHRTRLAGSPFQRWLGTAACSWGYRRGFVAVFGGTQQVVFDAWGDLFTLGPVESVSVSPVRRLADVSSLRLFLDRPCVRSLSLVADDLRDDCLDHLRRAADWLRALDRVDLSSVDGDYAAADRLRAWLDRDPTLAHVTLGSRFGPHPSRGFTPLS